MTTSAIVLEITIWGRATGITGLFIGEGVAIQLVDILVRLEASSSVMRECRRVLAFPQVDEHLATIRIKVMLSNISHIFAHTQMKRLEWAYVRFDSQDIKILYGYFKARVDKEEDLSEKFSLLHEICLNEQRGIVKPRGCHRIG